MASAVPDPDGLARSLIKWWADAGVDWLAEDVPVDWLARPTPAGRAGRTAPVAPPAPPPPSALPPDLPAFHRWWLEDQTVLAPFPPRCRLAPEGKVAAPLLLLLDMPERDDDTRGRLWSGDGGALLDRMLGALGLKRADVALATLAPGRTAHGRLDAAAIAALAPIARHMVALFAPQRLWLLGHAASRALLTANEREASGRLHAVNHDAGTVPAIATVSPLELLREGREGGPGPLRQRTWDDMRRLMETGG